MKLSPSMIKALRSLNRGVTWPLDFRTMEALRRRGLAERYTTKSIGAVFVTKDGADVQYRATARKPQLIHEWWATLDGLTFESKELCGND
jgi:hypothetical protein